MIDLAFWFVIVNGKEVLIGLVPDFPFLSNFFTRMICFVGLLVWLFVPSFFFFGVGFW